MFPIPTPILIPPQDRQTGSGGRPCVISPISFRADVTENSVYPTIETRSFGVNNETAVLSSKTTCNRAEWRAGRALTRPARFVRYNCQTLSLNP